MKKPVFAYTYRDHLIEVSVANVGAFTVSVEGPHLNVTTETYSLANLTQAVERAIDLAVLEARAA